ncbi:DEAD/DEAH box helicase [Bacillus lacus]|uniref:DEAD/DEAH box helicase n=1 Tax=Metabacillus lacus TaxID=1983721 RepID=A0A7X2IZD0_9BACI|nr:DEAD/DEAH box helicase [Metabacillus lacus]MRX71953.1 DEAD/DEAH box helicase [Metabacillus lacus]
MNSFDLLSKFLQKKIWDMRWSSFTNIQEKAIPAVLQTEDDVVLSAGTASGKTEAAFLPVLTEVEASAGQALKILYISPLKALINNQFERINKLCEYMNIEIHRWHGDVSQSKKQKFIKNPTGILQITPESIESLFINRPGALSTLFKELEFVVIDEIHSFIDKERGVQLRSLLSRIEEFATKRPRIVGLSATIGNFDLVKEWINFKYPENVTIIEDKSSDKQLLYSLMFFETDKDNKKPIELFEDMREITKEQKSIIFCNSRGSVEETTVFLNRLAEREGMGETYYAHHSSIDKKEREYVEKVMSETNMPKSVVATSSLELGIDIGNVDLVVQLDSTYTVSSLKQRLGRSGRERDASQMLQLYSTSKDSLLQSLAVMELVLDKWIEPATGYAIPYDILFHQLISVCAEKNGMTIKQLLHFVHNNDIFHSLESHKAELLINYMIEKDILEKLSGRGELIVGIEGERILRSKEFYSVFMTNEEYEVVEGTRKIGQVDKTPFIFEGDNIILSGRLWTVISLDSDRNKAYVRKAVNAKPPKYFGDGGKIHKRIGEKMMEVLSGEDEFEYIDYKSKSALEELRRPYKLYEVGIQHRALWKNKREYLIETFTSTQITTTLHWMMRVLDVNVLERDLLGRIRFEYSGDINDLFFDLKSCIWDEKEIVEKKKKISDFPSKFATYIPEYLKDEMHIKHELDLKGALEFLNDFELKIIELEF